MLILLTSSPQLEALGRTPNRLLQDPGPCAKPVQCHELEGPWPMITH